MKKYKLILVYGIAFVISVVALIFFIFFIETTLIIRELCIPFWNKLGGFRETYKISYHLLFILLGVGLLVHAYQSRKRILSAWTVFLFILIASFYIYLTVISDSYVLLPIDSAISYYFIVFVYVVFQLVRGIFVSFPYIKGESKPFRAVIFITGKNIENTIQTLHSLLKQETQQKRDDKDKEDSICELLKQCFKDIWNCIFKKQCSKQEKQEVNKPNGFFYDTPITTEENFTHGLRREDAAKKIAELISQTNNADAAFAVGISGKWGSGKTSFMNFIIKELKKDRNSNNRIIIEFSPWKNHGASTIIVDFFKTLGAALEPYIFRIKPKLQKYASLLLDSDAVSGNVQKAVKAIKALTTADNSIETLYKEIKEDILRLDHQIVICIDDLDRLYANEIIETLKLIRNSANFGNTVFIVTYDKDYVLANIGREISKHDNYLEKIISVEFYLPLYDSSILSECFYKSIEEYRSKEIAEEIEKGLGDFNFFTNQYFSSIRDVKCLTNNFISSLKLLSNNCLSYHLLLIEYLKYKHVDVYELLFYKQKDLLNNDKVEFLCEKDDINEKIKNENALAIVKFLFPKDKNRNVANAIYHTYYYNYYFFGRVPDNHLKKDTFDKFLKSTTSDLEIYLKDKSFDFNSVADKIIEHEIKSIEEYYNIVILSFYALRQKNTYLINVDYKDLTLKNTIFHSCFDTHLVFLNRLMTNPIYPCYVERFIWEYFNEEFNEHDYPEVDYGFRIEDLQINDSLFFLENVFLQDKTFSEVVLFHWCNIYSKDYSYLYQPNDIQIAESRNEIKKLEVALIKIDKETVITSINEQEIMNEKNKLQQLIEDELKSIKSLKEDVESDSTNSHGLSIETIDRLIKLSEGIKISQLLKPIFKKYLDQNDVEGAKKVFYPATYEDIDLFLASFKLKYKEQFYLCEEADVILKEMVKLEKKKTNVFKEEFPDDALTEIYRRYNELLTRINVFINS